MTVGIDPMLAGYSMLVRRALWGILFSVSLIGCKPSEEGAHQPDNSSSPLMATFGRLDGGVVRLAQYRGRVTLVLFFATYDLASQVAAQRLVDLVHGHAPRVNAVAVALEIPKNIELVRSFRDVIKPPFEVVMGSVATQSGMLAGQKLRSVPTIWVLDEKGRKEFEFAGTPTPQQLVQAVKSLQ